MKHNSVFLVFTKSMLLGNAFLFFVVMILITILYYLLFRKVICPFSYFTWSSHISIIFFLKSIQVRERSSKVYAKSSTVNKAASRLKRESKLARTLAIVVAVSLAFWGPLMITYVVDYCLPYEQRVGETVANILSVSTCYNTIS